MDIDYFFHPYNNTRVNERCAEVALALEFISKYPDYVEVGAVMPYYIESDTWVIYPFDPKGSDDRRLADCDLTDLNVVSISTLEHIGIDQYGNKVINDWEALAGLKQIISTAKNYFITIPMGFNKLFDSQIESILPELNCYGILRKNKPEDPPEWIKVDPVTHLDYEYNKPFPFANFVLIITSETI